MLSAEGKASEDKASIQPDCLESSTVNEETGSVMRHDPTIVELETEGNKPFYRKVPCALPQGHVNHVRPHADMTVVGIVFALIALIVIIELWDSIRTT